MSEHKRASYSLAPPEPSQQFLQARNIAGTALQGEFDEVRADILALEQETEGMLSQILGELAQ
jgi:hypothetical protein